uniref:Uncharacterized protein n=1 Tax=Chromera velia CCMP2878 TaxID=1169474 RepID=A0A0G4F7R2_9ALVE|eukprot:Cvel_2935.t1-p1 / transcript=Cvel_2935.t1 / gene=Cvel_2935 / organism=Chromera_velia_CCMP2878 / gene_product=hypothetical protein / transcript_product=hypothetical protein / location=Cvel_scaffold116:28547-28951(+) / protein_length=135 / sequence_SO=supercontig / SO=protein_coding / is_pseudo=false
MSPPRALPCPLYPSRTFLLFDRQEEKEDCEGGEGEITCTHNAPPTDRGGFLVGTGAGGGRAHHYHQQQQHWQDERELFRAPIRALASHQKARPERVLGCPREFTAEFLSAGKCAAREREEGLKGTVERGESGASG